MKIIWVLENIKDNQNSFDYYTNSKLNVLLLLASVNLWRRNHPEDTCVLYADDITIDALDRLKVLDFWHKILPIPNPRKINKSVFWASSKLQVLASVKEHVILMDNDTHIYRPIKQYLDLDKVYVHNLEVGKGYYPTSLDEYLKKLSYKARWQTESVNVAFLNLPDYKFTNEYAELSLKIMEEFTNMEVPHPQYLIFAEQLVLKHLLDKKNIEYQPLISTDWDCEKWEWGKDNDKGIWKLKESGIFFKHYGPLKSWIKDNKADQNYDLEMNHLLNCINLPKLDLSSIVNK